MSLETRDNMMALNSGFDGAPYCEIGAKTGFTYVGLDWGFLGAPFVSLAVEGEGPTGFNARVKVGSFGQVMAAGVKVGGAWKAISAMKVKVDGSWRAV